VNTLSSASNLSGYLGGPTLPSALGNLGKLGGYAGAGYGIYKIATDPNLSTKEKVGQSARAATDVVLSSLPVVGQFYGAARALGLVGQHLEGSGSPQVRGLGRTLDYAAEPAGAKGFWDVVTGSRSPKAAFKAQGGAEGLMLDTMGPVGLIMRGLGVHLPGLYHEPTKGTQFRSGLQQAFKQLKLPDFNRADKNVYNISEEKMNSFSAVDRSAAMRMAEMLAPQMPGYSSNPEAYKVQAFAILLNTLGSGVDDSLNQLLPQLQGDAQAAPAPAQPMEAAAAAPRSGDLATVMRAGLAQAGNFTL